MLYVIEQTGFGAVYARPFGLPLDYKRPYCALSLFAPGKVQSIAHQFVGCICSEHNAYRLGLIPIPGLPKA